ncbi:MAG: hypothetical protein RR827_09420, partial [Oscillospiraceae bacterium]
GGYPDNVGGKPDDVADNRTLWRVTGRCGHRPLQDVVGYQEDVADIPTMVSVNPTMWAGNRTLWRLTGRCRHRPLQDVVGYREDVGGYLIIVNKGMAYLQIRCSDKRCMLY